MVNYLLFMDLLKFYRKTDRKLDTQVDIVRMFSNDFGMEFSISQSVIVVIKVKKYHKRGGINLPKENIWKIYTDDRNIYLSVLKTDAIKKQ